MIYTYASEILGGVNYLGDLFSNVCTYTLKFSGERTWAIAI